jgi:hypothetical protein
VHGKWIFKAQVLIAAFGVVGYVTAMEHMFPVYVHLIVLRYPLSNRQRITGSLIVLEHAFERTSVLKNTILRNLDKQSHVLSNEHSRKKVAIWQKRIE